MKNIVFLVSGGGANLKFVQYSIRVLNLHCRISGVIADRDILFQDFLKEENKLFSANPIRFMLIPEPISFIRILSGYFF